MHTFGTPEQWTAAGTWALAFVTLALALGAFWAGWLALRQVRLAQEQLAEARRTQEESLRPLVVPVAYERGDRSIDITFKNIGPGPALDIIINAAFKSTLEVGLEGRNAALTAFYAAFIRPGRTPLARWPGLGPGGESKLMVPQEDTDGENDGGVVAWAVEYQDVYRTHFDSGRTDHGDMRPLTMAVE